VKPAALGRILRLRLEYDGTAYCGWQRQRGAAVARPPSVQATVEAAVAAVTGEAVRVVGAGRTDAGVHALGQVAHCTTGCRIAARRLSGAFNAYLPPDVRVLHVEDAALGFHARFDARARTYRYEILNRPAPPALLRNRVYHVAEPLDVDAMRRALVPLLGAHDFTAYRGAGSAARTSACTLEAAEIVRRGCQIHVTITADRFLRHMVRMIVGSLVRVGTGRLSVAAPGEYLHDRDNRRTGPTAPAHGLYLVRVDYGERSKPEPAGGEPSPGHGG